MENIVTMLIPINPIVVGKIRGAYGVKGWIKIISFTDKAEDIFCYKQWFILLQNQWKLMTIEYWRLIKKLYIVKLVDISDRNVAISLTNCDLLIDASQLPILKDHEYYWKDIIGCQVITIQGNNLLGYIDFIIETIFYDVLVVKIVNNNLIKSKDNCLIPFIQDKIIKSINLVKNVIIVDWDYNF